MPPDPLHAIAWQLWYRDTFDAECEPSVEATGVGLPAGLAKLWARHLFETVQPQGPDAFSRFHLRTDGGRIEIAGSDAGAKRLRGWLFGSRSESLQGCEQQADSALLATLAAVHARRIDRPGAAAEILSLAESSADAAAFLARLAQ